ncbi:Glutathione amide reductase [Astathelohania contejeani]|uniref:Glutathione amide reductase n=1 Tax=Astathelohania contejeani TaxID=164912 RepID=A0ABQ7HXK5_9MICR|nr:Glutathione amide reductase [Thelohania contejeani]
MPEKIYDLIVIGGGSAGISTAIRSSANGADVLLIEKNLLGGTCVNYGCMPKKLCHIISDHKYRSEALSSDIIYGDCEIDWKRFTEMRNAYISRLNNIYYTKLKSSGVNVIHDYAVLVGGGAVEVSGRTIRGKNILLGTGSKPIRLNIPGSEFIKTSDDFFLLNHIPKKLVIIGTGYIAAELAFIIRSMGGEVILIGISETVLENFDPLISERVANELKIKGCELILGANTEKIIKEETGYTVITDICKIEDVEMIIGAIGRYCTFEYSKVPFAQNKSFLRVDDFFMTSVPNVYAVGDVIGPKNMLTPVAIFCGRKLADHLFKKKESSLIKKYEIFEYVPTAVFTNPPCAMVGYTEPQARKLFNEVEIHQSEFVNSFFSLCDNKEKSVFKIIVGDGRVVGLHLFGVGSDEIIQGFAVAIKKGITYEDIKNTIGVHPTAAEEVVTMK